MCPRFALSRPAARRGPPDPRAGGPTTARALRLRPEPESRDGSHAHPHGDPGRSGVPGRPCRVRAGDGRRWAEGGNPPIVAPSGDSIQLARPAVPIITAGIARFAIPGPRIGLAQEAAPRQETTMGATEARHALKYRANGLAPSGVMGVWLLAGMLGAGPARADEPGAMPVPPAPRPVPAARKSHGPYLFFSPGGRTTAPPVGPPAAGGGGGGGAVALVQPPARPPYLFFSPGKRPATPAPIGPVARPIPPEAPAPAPPPADARPPEAKDEAV